VPQNSDKISIRKFEIILFYKKTGFGGLRSGESGIWLRERVLPPLGLDKVPFCIGEGKRDQLFLRRKRSRFGRRGLLEVLANKGKDMRPNREITAGEIEMLDRQI